MPSSANCAARFGSMPGYEYDSSSRGVGQEARADQLEFELNDGRLDGAAREHKESRGYPEAKRPLSWPGWSPRTWTTWQRAIFATVLVLAFLGIVIPVAVTRANRYPDYSKLNYAFQEAYSGASFFDNFEYFHSFDPTAGFVHYVDPSYAKTYNLTYATETSAVVKVDTTVGPGSSPDASTGRFSVRLESKKQYNKGLFLFDVKHTPYGCATWPALWLSDSNNWPANGEIDIMEAVNQANTGNMMTLHTTSGCDMMVKRKMTGSSGQLDCHNSTNGNTGCGVTASETTYGAKYNAAGGGIMAVEWRSEGIRMWQFRRNSVPADIAAQKPDPSSWGKALADFPSTRCDMSSHFRNQSIIINIDLCGILVEATWKNSGCSASTCSDYVAKNPSVFVDAFWEFGNFWIYKAV